MPRLIDADELLKHAYDSGAWKDAEIGFHQRVVDIEDIEDAPTVKPSLYGQCWGCKCEAIKPGHWKRTKAYPNIIFCDECGEAFEQRGHWNYCPNCGAMMDDACGRWHKQGDEYRCSECGDTSIVAFKKCPKCGCKMDEVEDEE